MSLFHSAASACRGREWLRAHISRRPAHAAHAAHLILSLPAACRWFNYLQAENPMTNKPTGSYSVRAPRAAPALQSAPWCRSSRPAELTTRHRRRPPPTAAAATAASPQLWLVFFYLLSAVLMVSLGLCVFVASCFKSGSFPVVWPVKLLRALVSVVFSVLFVSSLDVFLGPRTRSPSPDIPAGLQRHAALRFS